ncbi:MAG: metallophosphatase domain-containing protein [Sphingobacteriales bacterium]|nr:metallophosphatase domain-containing protein [Sphingobacteriales bacterium]OJY85662.1 MAG: hypothetical protein BGP14_00525 [Sphingobacteriales bacterium 44-15]
MFQANYKNKTITAISDTHGNHRELKIPETDFLIHCGDTCTDGNETQLKDFFDWFGTQPAQYKIFVAGNHDLPFDLEPGYAAGLVPAAVIYLENRSIVINDISFYSVAARPWLHDLPPQIEKIGFLLTHGPPYTILDRGIGCKNLLKFVKRQKPVYHLFGHIHQHAQQHIVRDGISFANLCCLGL